MKASEFSVKNSLLVNCLSVFLVIVGLLALLRIEREVWPNLSFDIVTVRTDYKGAAPDIIEKRITLPIEDKLKEVDGLDEVGSISLEGLSLVIIKLDPDASDKPKIISDIERAVQRVNDLPDDLEDDPLVEEINSKDTPLLEVSLSGDLDEPTLRRLAKNLESEIEDLSGVSGVIRKGYREEQVIVEVDPQTLTQKHLSFNEIVRALALRNLNIAGGLLKGDKRELLIRTSGEFESAEDVKPVVIRGNDAGNWIQIKDVATVTEGFEDETIITRTDSTRAINLLVIKKDLADALRLKEQLNKLIDGFSQKNPPQLKIALVNDYSYYVSRRLNVLVSNGIIGLIFVTIPLIIFMSWRVALGAVMGMPVAFLTAMAAMKYFGISINLISLFGLIIVLGMLVDEDVVIAENIGRYLEMGLSPAEAAVKGAAEVSRAIISTVATTIIAFVPLLFMTGIFGKFIADIPKTVIITLAASLLEALIILPAHLSGLHKNKNTPKELHSNTPSKKHHYEKIRNFYSRTLAACMKRPLVTSIIALLITALAITYGIVGIKFILFPAKGIESFFIRAEAVMGTPLATTEKLILPLEQLVANLPAHELDHYVTQIGITQNDPTDPFTSRGSHLAQIQVFLSPETHRDRDAQMITEDLRQHTHKLEGLNKILFEPVRPGPPVGKPVAVKIRGDDFETLNEIAEIYKAALEKIDGVKDIRNDYELGKNELRLVFNEKLATQAGLTVPDIGNTIRQAFDGARATVIRKTDEEVAVVVRLKEEFRKNSQTIQNLLILNKFGNLVPVSKVATFVEKPSLEVIRHLDNKRVVTVTANVDETLTTAKEVNGMLKNDFKNLAERYPEYTFKYGGEEEDTNESMESLFHALIGALVLIFMVLLVTFGELTQTMVLMLTIPFGAVGVVIGFALNGEPFSFLAIVVDGGTLLFTFANQLRANGMPLKEALIHACEIRLRPILLTTLTTVLGVIPAAYGIGGNDPFIQPMALAMNWGLAFSMLFTLYAIPCIYLILIQLETRVKSWIGLL